MLIGGIACRFEKAGGRVRLYIMTLGVLAPYRGRGVGQRLLVRALTEGAKENVEDVYLHVQARRAQPSLAARPSPAAPQVINTEAVEFYKKFGFEVKERIAGYYKRLDPPDCFLLSRSMSDWSPPQLALPGDDTSDRTLDAP